MEKEEYMSIFAQNLKNYRKKNNLSQVKLEKMAGVASTTVNHSELCYRFPGIGTLIKLSKAMNMSLDELILGRTITPAYTIEHPNVFYDAISLINSSEMYMLYDEDDTITFKVKKDSYLNGFIKDYIEIENGIESCRNIEDEDIKFKLLDMYNQAKNQILDNLNNYITGKEAE